MTGLDALFAHVLLDFSDAVARSSGSGESPSLAQWSNFLRVMPDQSIALNDIAIAARVSRRVIKSRRGMPADWVEVTSGTPRNAAWRLTESGRRAREAGRAAVATTETAWLRAVGAAATKPLRQAAELFVSALELELSWYPMPYGPADRSAAGGSSVPAKDGPPRLPAHGADWKPVVRAADADTVSDVPLYALMSQGYVAFQIEYEQLAGYPKVSVDSVVRAFPAPRMSLAALPARLGVDGSGRPPLERHGVVQVDMAANEAVLTSQGRDLVENHAARVQTIEADWRARYSPGVTDGIQAALTAVNAELPQDLPDHVFVWQWSDLSRLG